MGFWGAISQLHAWGVSELDVDKIKTKMDKMMKKQDEAMKNLSLGDKYKLDDTDAFFKKFNTQEKK